MNRVIVVIATEPSGHTYIFGVFVDRAAADKLLSKIDRNTETSYRVSDEPLIG